jgi:RecA-family ATPase
MPLSMVEMQSRERASPDWIIRGLLKRGNTAIVLGAPKKACKSWLILALCWDLSEGKPVWSVKTAAGEYVFPVTRPMRCVYFTQEDTEDDIHDRVLAHLSAGRVPSDRLWVEPKNLQIAFDTQEGRRLIREKLDEVVARSGAIDLVAFDPMRRMHHGDENDSKTIVAIWDVLDRIHRRYGCATVMTHHIRKPSVEGWDPTDPFVGRGSGDIYGGGDAFVNVVPGRGTETERVLGVYYESKRGKPLPPSQLKLTYGTGQVTYLGGGQPARQTQTDSL